jgi:hypothetical protein
MALAVIGKGLGNGPRGGKQDARAPANRFLGIGRASGIIVEKPNDANKIIGSAWHTGRSRKDGGQMKRMKLWVILILLFLVITGAIVFGRGWIGFSTGFDASGEKGWGPYWDGGKYKEDMSKFQRWLGLKKDIETPGEAPQK